MRGTFICTECGNVIHSRYEMFQERMEYRRVDCDERPLSFAVRDICRKCVEDIREARRNPSGAVQEQLSL